MPGKSKARQIVESELREAAQIALGTAQARYCKAFDRRAHGYALLGHNNEEIAELLGIDPSTLDRWVVEQPSLRAALTKARVDDYVRITKSMHRAANGYRHRETKLNVVDGKLEKTDITKHYPPNQVAAQFILGNRQGARWKDTKTVEHTGKVDLLAAIKDSLGDRAKPVQATVIDQTASDADEG